MTIDHHATVKLSRFTRKPFIWCISFDSKAQRQVLCALLYSNVYTASTLSAGNSGNLNQQLSCVPRGEGRAS